MPGNAPQPDYQSTCISALTFYPCRTAEPETSAVELCPQDKWLILATDGVWEFIDPQVRGGWRCGMICHPESVHTLNLLLQKRTEGGGRWGWAQRLIPSEDHGCTTTVAPLPPAPNAGRD